MMPAALTAEELQWYADFVAHCNGQDRAATAASPLSAVQELDAQPLNECLLMHGLDHLDGRFRDSTSQLWSHDQYGRWFTKVDQKMVWLQSKLAELRYRRGPRRAKKTRASKSDLSECVSHICGNCGCIRLQHIRYQSKSEDALDRAHHSAPGSGIRPDLLAQITPKPIQNSSDFSDLPAREITPRLTSQARRLRARIDHTES